MRVLSADLAERRANPAGGPATNVLDALARSATVDTDDRDLAEVYLSCLFAVAGSIGFLLGWSLYLLGTSRTDGEVRPAWVVREALRLWPVAWLFNRQPSRVFDLGGTTVTPGDDVLVCGYLVHRDPDRWPDPDEFRPSRWASVSSEQQHAYVPFGWGPHACTGAAVSLYLVETLVELITSRYRLDVTVTDSQPHVAAALAPPRFLLRLGHLPEARGGEDSGEALLRGQAGAQHLRP
jgi:cytochrome P450